MGLYGGIDVVLMCIDVGRQGSLLMELILFDKYLGILENYSVPNYLYVEGAGKYGSYRHS